MTRPLISITLAAFLTALSSIEGSIAQAKQQCSAAMPSNPQGHWWSYRLIDGRNAGTKANRRFPNHCRVAERISAAGLSERLQAPFQRKIANPLTRKRGHQTPQPWATVRPLTLSKRDGALRTVRTSGVGNGCAADHARGRCGAPLKKNRQTAVFPTLIVIQAKVTHACDCPDQPIQAGLSRHSGISLPARSFELLQARAIAHARSAKIRLLVTRIFADPIKQAATK